LLQSFCRLTPSFETIAKSLSYVPRDVFASLSVASLIIAKILLLALVWAVQRAATGHFSHPAFECAGFALMGFLVGDLSLTIVWRPLMRCYLLLPTHVDQVNRKLSAYEELTGRIYGEIWKTLLISGYGFLRAAKDPACVILGIVVVLLGMAKPLAWGVAAGAIAGRGLYLLVDRATCGPRERRRRE
jgi:hypothetical protein